MNEKIEQHLLAYAKKEGWLDDDGKTDLVEIILEYGEKIYQKLISDHRWWDNYFVVKNIDGMLIGFEDAQTTGDENAYDKGWEFDPETVCEVEKVEKIVYEYNPVQQSA